MGSMTVAVSWSGYFNKLLHLFNLHLPDYLTQDPGSYQGSGFSMNLPATVIVLLITALLVKGTKEAAKANNLIVILKVSAVLFVIVVGAFYVNAANWTPFVPEVAQVSNNGEVHDAYGWAGVISGAAAIFFAYVGFDAVSTQAGEAINPKKDVPFAIIMSLLVCTVLYILVSLVLTGMMNYSDFNPAGKYPDAIKAPVAAAFDLAGMPWAVFIITVAATVGLISVMMVMLLGQSRIFMGMSKDGLIPKFFSDLHVKNKTPYKSNILIGLIVALVAGFTPISTLADMTSFGTLFAFTMVCIAVWMLRVKEPNLQRNFKVPALPLIAVLGIGINIFLMSKLNLHAIQLSGAWLVLGVVIYFVYSKQNSKLRKAANA